MITKFATIGLLGLLLIDLSGFTGGVKNKRTDFTEPEYCLTISGKVLNAENKIRKKITVYLINNNSIIDSVKTNPNSVFSFQLKKETEYSIKIVEPQSITRLISISTRIPGKVKNNLLFQFHFDLLPFKPSPELASNPDILDFPLALIHYNPQKGCFDYNRKYTAYIKKTYNQAIFQTATN